MLSGPDLRANRATQGLYEPHPWYHLVDRLSDHLPGAPHIDDNELIYGSPQLTIEPMQGPSKRITLGSERLEERVCVCVLKLQWDAGYLQYNNKKES